jgi:hypothetical protein
MKLIHYCIQSIIRVNVVLLRVMAPLKKALPDEYLSGRGSTVPLMIFRTRAGRFGA